MISSTTLRPPRSTLFPYTTLFRSYPTRLEKVDNKEATGTLEGDIAFPIWPFICSIVVGKMPLVLAALSRHKTGFRSEEHTSELQSRENLVCRLLLEKKKKNKHKTS